MAFRFGVFGRLCLTLSSLALIIVFLPTSAQAKPITREEVRRWYSNTYLPPSLKPATWNGDVSRCDPGNVGPRKRKAIQSQINALRSFVGLAQVEVKTSRSVQQTALMMHAQGALSHYPGVTWLCYSLLGAQVAAQSNLALSYTGRLGAPVELYMDEPGSSNKAVGHRRWVLLPSAQVFRVGATSQAQALQVIGVPRRTSYLNPKWVSWPREGNFPRQLEPSGRWSLTSGNPDFRWQNPRVTVRRNGEKITNIKVHRPEYGYGNPTLAWEVPGRIRTGVYTVRVKSGPTGDVKLVRKYRVRIFNA